MKKIVLAIVLPLVLFSCNPENQLPVDNGGKEDTPADTVAPKPALVAPTNLNVQVTDVTKATLTWENESTDYDGVEVQKAGPNGKYKMMGNVPAGVLTYNDVAFTENGQYSYRLCSYKGNTYSDYAVVEFTISGIPDPTPELKIDKVETATGVMFVYYSIVDDLGGTVDSGIEWGEGNSFSYSKRLRTGGSGLGFVFGPEGPTTIRAWAKPSSGGPIGYSEPQTVTPAAEPEAYNVTYTDVTPAGLPSEIKVYQASTTVTGKPTNIWYATADLSTGNVELRALCNDGSKKKTSVMATQAGTPYVFVNGGFFGGSTSVSYVLDQGTRISENSASVARSDVNYYISRGVFGATQSGETSVCWRFGGSVNGGPYFYPVPIPQIEGKTALVPSSTFPAAPVNPGYYSAIGAGPVLIKDGTTRVNFHTISGVYSSNFELFPSDIYSSSTRQPRTAIGRTADGKVVLMVVDGRNTGVSEGVVLTDLARLMKGVGCVDALNLDGGGSSAFCAGLDMKVLNRPSDGSERAVTSIVGFAKK